MIAIALAWISIPASLLINLVLAIFFAIPLHYATKTLMSRDFDNVPMRRH
jgi:hypothetical protein